MEARLSGLRRTIYRLFIKLWNAVVPADRSTSETSSPAFRQIQERAQRNTDISDHLPTLFLEAYACRPSLIVELGVRGGESTYVFERVASMYDAELVSVDLEPCDTTSEYDRWHFVEADDVEFGHRFSDWCEARDIDPRIDVLFVDTSHLYDHTVAELQTWMPHLGAEGIALFHDTNLTPLYRRQDGSLGLGWDNDRGVIRALEEYLGGLNFDESTAFETLAGGFAVKHYPHCNGLTVLYHGP